MKLNHNPQIEPTDPALFKLRMGRISGGRLLAICYLEFDGLPPGVTVLDAAGAPIPDDGPTQYILDTETFEGADAAEQAKRWFEETCKTQPWIKRH